MKLALFLCGFVIFLDASRNCECAKILAYFQIPSYSHHITYRPLWRELAKRGHKLTLLTINLMEENENITQVDLSGVYKILEKYHTYEKLSSDESMFTVVMRVANMMSEALEYQISHPEVQKIIKDENFDLVMMEFITSSGFAIARKDNIPVIGLMSMDGHYNAHDAVGNPTHPVAYPSYDVPFFKNLNFRQRVLSTLYSLAWRGFMKFILYPKYHKIAKKYFPDAPQGEEVMKNVSMLFVNANPLFNNVRPLGPKTINIAGGIHLSEPKPLPKDLQDYLDNAPNGVIYFNLGSNVKSMHISNRTKDVILQTFAQLPYQILWKFEDDQLAERPANIKIMSWLPQQDILRHKNIKLFITQGGIQSMEEAIFNHVPMIGLPFFGDQLGNTNKMAAMGYGLELDHTHLDVKTFKATILEVINNSRYKQKAKELADLVLDQPMTGLEKAVWWTEYVLRHGNTDHFRDSIVDLPLYQYYLLDVIFFLLLVVLLGLYIVYKFFQVLKTLIVFLYSRIFSSKKIKTL